MVTGAEVTALDADGEGWEVRCGVQRFHCGVVVNAAGAWADVVGGLAGAKSIGLAPLRRTAITFDPPPGVDIAPWPCVIDVDEEFYVKPEGARLLPAASAAGPRPLEPTARRAERTWDHRYQGLEVPGNDRPPSGRRELGNTATRDSKPRATIVRPPGG